MDYLKLALDLGIGLAAFRLAWSVDRTQKDMLKIQAQQATMIQEILVRIGHLESK